MGVVLRTDRPLPLSSPAPGSPSAGPRSTASHPGTAPAAKSPAGPLPGVGGTPSPGCAPCPLRVLPLAVRVAPDVCAPRLTPTLRSTDGDPPPRRGALHGRRLHCRPPLEVGPVLPEARRSAPPARHARGAGGLELRGCAHRCAHPCAHCAHSGCAHFRGACRASCAGDASAVKRGPQDAAAACGGIGPAGGSQR